MGALPRRSGRADVAIALGGNLGTRREIEDRFAAARRHIESVCGAPAAMSRLRRTRPVGPVRDQPDFWNAALRVSAPATISPEALLAELLAFETRCGRVRRATGGPRTIDLDLLWFADRAIESAGLTVPHPRLRDRAFVLEPLLDLYGDDFRLPVTGERLGDLIRG